MHWINTKIPLFASLTTQATPERSNYGVWSLLCIVQMFWLSASFKTIPKGMIFLELWLFLSSSASTLCFWDPFWKQNLLLKKSAVKCSFLVFPSSSKTHKKHRNENSRTRLFSVVFFDRPDALWCFRVLQ